MTYGQNMVFGVTASLPLRGFPEGRARIRKHKAEFTSVSICQPQGCVRRFYVGEHDGAWWPAFEIGANVNQPKRGL